MEHGIKRREAREQGFTEITGWDFVHDMVDAANCGQDVHTWTGKDRDGAPLMVMWTVGPVTGQALSVYEIPGR
jgi:hypothetical protein